MARSSSPAIGCSTDSEPLRRYTPSPISRILAVVCFTEYWPFTFFAPYLVASSARVLRESFIPFSEMPVDCPLAFIDRRVVAVVNDRTGHAAEDRLYNIQELGTAG